MVRKYVMLAVISAMVFLAVGCQNRTQHPGNEQVKPGSSNDLWKGYGDVDTTPRPKYRNMPPLKK
jgi:uncharacterized lipoprotein NlpE involved in copper resistance